MEYAYGNEEYISSLCLAWQKCHDSEEKERIFTKISEYCYRLYYKRIKTLNAERDDIWQEVMFAFSQSEIDKYLERRRSTNFESFFWMITKNKAFDLSNQGVGANTAYIYCKIREMSAKYGIPINENNAHKFSRLGNFTISKILYALEGYATVISLENVKGGAYS